MVRRGWAPETLLGMTPGDFTHWLRVAVDAAKAEAKAMRQAGNR